MTFLKEKSLLVMKHTPILIIMVAALFFSYNFLVMMGSFIIKLDFLKSHTLAYVMMCVMFGFFSFAMIAIIKSYIRDLRNPSRVKNYNQAVAQYNRGVSYYYGEGVKQDKKAAFQWFTRAAEQGLAQAQYNLGLMYDRGEGIKTNQKEAVRWWLKAAQQDLALAQFNLGGAYFDSKGVKQDKEEAVQWWLKAARQGHAEAQFNLGVMYHNGAGVMQDKKEAVKWLTKAAGQGYAHAQEALNAINETSRAKK